MHHDPGGHEDQPAAGELVQCRGRCRQRAPDRRRSSQRRRPTDAPRATAGPRRRQRRAEATRARSVRAAARPEHATRRALHLRTKHRASTRLRTRATGTASTPPRWPRARSRPRHRTHPDRTSSSAATTDAGATIRTTVSVTVVGANIAPSTTAHPHQRPTAHTACTGALRASSPVANDGPTSTGSSAQKPLAVHTTHRSDGSIAHRFAHDLRG